MKNISTNEPAKRKGIGKITGVLYLFFVLIPCAVAYSSIKLGLKIGNLLVHTKLHIQRRTIAVCWLPFCRLRYRLLRDKEKIRQDDAFLGAVIRGDQHNVIILLERGANPDTKAMNEVSALLFAVHYRNVIIVRLLLEAKANPNARFPITRDTALVEAVKHNSIEMVRLLLQHGAEIDARGFSGLTPLIYATGCGYSEVVKLLLEYGANPYIKAKDGHNAKYYATQSNSPEVVALFEKCC